MQVKFEANMFLVAQINPRLYKFLVFEKKKHRNYFPYFIISAGETSFGN